MTDKDGVRFAWMGEPPFLNNGYGTQARRILPILKEHGLNFGVYSTRGSRAYTQWRGIPVFPSGPDEKSVGADMLPMSQSLWGAQAILSMFDVDHINMRSMPPVPWIAWTPIDHFPASKNIVNRLKGASGVWAMSEFGRAELEKAGIDSIVVPNVVDTETFSPMDKREAWRRLGKEEYADFFWVGLVCANYATLDRKAISEQLVAFADFAKGAPDARIYIHSLVMRVAEGNTGLLDIHSLIGELGLQDKFIAPAQDRYYANMLDDAYMVNAYNAIDVLLSATSGEGFGVPIIEAQACGKPVIVSNWTAMPELVGAGITVDAGQLFRNSRNAWWVRPNIAAISQSLEAMYATWKDEKEKYAEMCTVARDFSLSYDSRLITERIIVPYLSNARDKMIEVAQRVSAPKTVAVAGSTSEYSSPNAILVQSAYGTHSEMLRATMPAYAAYCRKYNITYMPVEGKLQNEVPPHWDKVKLIQWALSLPSVEYVIWADADTAVVRDEEDIRTAVDFGEIAMCTHWEKNIGVHHNSGVMVIRNTERMRKFFDMVWDDRKHQDFEEQLSINEFLKLEEFEEALVEMDDKWNSGKDINESPDPIIVAFHGYRDTYHRTLAVKAALEEAWGESRCPGY